MPLHILGLSAFYHDSAATLLIDGRIVAAAQEERFTRLKHDPSLPKQAIAYCLREGGITVSDLDYVVFYDKPFLKFDRLLETYLAFAPAGLSSFLEAMPVWLQEKLHLPRLIRQALGPTWYGRLVFTGHHQAHAASAFYPSPFESAAILTVDGVGEWETATIGVGQGHRLEMRRALRFPHSLGLLYSAFTYFCGFKVNSGEYKLMGLAPYGQPRYLNRIRDHLLDLREDGSFALDQRYFNYCQGLTMTSRAFDQLFDGPPRRPTDRITARERDLAASIQALTEEILWRMARTVFRETGQQRLCLAGGVALNCVANAHLRRAGPFQDIWVQPAAGDAGGSLGAALFLHHHLLEHNRLPDPEDSMQGALLGPAFSEESISAILEEWQLPFRHIPEEDCLLRETASAIASGQVIGWMQGRMEFGPRALGARSILADPRNPEIQSRLNMKIKFRESFRPFAPSVLAEDFARYFEGSPTDPYMLLTAPVRSELRQPLQPADRDRATSDDLCERVNLSRSTIPAVTHLDYSARVQVVDEKRHGRYWRLLREFKRQTGCGVVVNTSFNIRSEPIVCTPEDALRCYLGTDMDLLVIGHFLLEKSSQPTAALAAHRGHRDAFQAD